MVMGECKEKMSRLFLSILIVHICVLFNMSLLHHTYMLQMEKCMYPHKNIYNRTPKQQTTVLSLAR